MAPHYSFFGSSPRNFIKKGQNNTKKPDKISGAMPERPDSPCIAICSTTAGDDICRGCGRTLEEISNWIFMGPDEREVVWRRIETERTALRYTTYQHRAAENLMRGTR